MGRGNVLIGHLPHIVRKNDEESNSLGNKFVTCYY